MEYNLYESASPEMLAEIVREAESLLDEQRTVAVAADQRAVTFAGLLVAAIGAMLGAVASLGGHAPVAIVAVATILSVAAGLALWSARPTGWKFRGNAPSQWTRDIIGERDMHASMAEMAMNYDVAWALNDKAIGSAARAMRSSMLLTALSVVAALAWSWWFVLRAAI
ncbi:hypothetical protein [Sphingomonas sp. Leaf230]|uniref:hypothetical protein n=1 Tax=Sphingomonas sp. Leaf230 TaxID=1735694 RepID=UPI0012E0CDD1|nr:hypothetical protein [Sphingomonas sp. Leaf230]